MLLGNQALGDVELGSFSIPIETPITTVFITPTPAVITVFSVSPSTSGCVKYPRAIGPARSYRLGQATPWYGHLS